MIEPEALYKDTSTPSTRPVRGYSPVMHRVRQAQPTFAVLKRITWCIGGTAGTPTSTTSFFANTTHRGPLRDLTPQLSQQHLLQATSTNSGSSRGCTNLVLRVPAGRPRGFARCHAFHPPHECALFRRNSVRGHMPELRQGAPRRLPVLPILRGPGPRPKGNSVRVCRATGIGARRYWVAHGSDL